jgi:hypothetical protein
MSSPIERFLERLRAAESRNQRELVMTLMEARDLHSDITRLLLRLETAAGEPDVVTVELKGEDF